MSDEIPEYWGVGFFGESLFQMGQHGEDLSAAEPREMYPNVTEDLDI